MKFKNTVITSSLSGLSTASADGHYHNPSLRYAQFVFCDDQPNENHQGIKHEDFPEVAASAIGTPVKMRFLGEAAGAHVGAIPIGHITDMEEHAEGGVNSLVAQAVLYASDYPDEIEYLEEAFAGNKAPGISFELAYSSSVVENGISWLKGLVTRAAAFVKNPAYGTRTALLALASNNSLTDEQFADGLKAIANELQPKNTDKGGNIKVEKELEEIKAKLEVAEKALAEKTTELETANASITTLTTEKDALQSKVTEGETALAEIARKNMITTRAATLAEAGMKLDADVEKLATKHWVALDDTAFAEYVDDLKGAIKDATPVKTGLASLRASASRSDLPRLTPEDSDKGSRLSGLRERMAQASINSAE